MPVIPAKDCLPFAEVFAPANVEESMLMYGLPGLAYEPTDAFPGSAEKVAILAKRAELGLPLFHPHDRTSFEGAGTYAGNVDPYGIDDVDLDEIEFESQLEEYMK